MWLYLSQQQSQHKNALFESMKQYSYSLEGSRFPIDFVDANTAQPTLSLIETPQELYALFPIPYTQEMVLKIYRLQDDFAQEYAPWRHTMLFWYFGGSFFILLLALMFAWYTQAPLRASIGLLETFLKDMIHDLNTPVTTLLLNAKMLHKDYKLQRVTRMELAANTIASLHKNLDVFLRDATFEKEPVALKPLIEARAAYFNALYETLQFHTHLEDITYYTQKEPLLRILDNLLSNACKYNRPHGSVTITLTQSTLVIADTGVGIKNPKRIFERFYKEHERGLGIGLHIVKKLCDTLHFGIEVKSDLTGTVFTLTF